MLSCRLRHENIVRLIGAGSDPERFLIIERLDGGTLAQRCGSGVGVRDRRRRFKRKQPFNYIELMKCGRQLAEGLRYLHEEAIPGRIIIHRDLKVS
jgi:serine/threonine protein kinase